MLLKILHIEDTCTGCGACVSSCPKQALCLSYDKEGFYVPRLDAKKCINCKICEKSCHVLNSAVPSIPSLNYKAYMIKAKDKTIVSKSSSGGAFSLLANHILSEGGIVYGARYNFKEERLEHSSSDKCSMDELRKSKYIESYMGNTFKEVQDQLVSGRKVLFCGTPCQVEGLHYFLTRKKIDITNLLLVRFICHGVPSNQFFTEYKHYEEKKHKSQIIAFDFRPKTNGWRSSDWKMTFANGKTEKGPYYYYYYYYYFQLCNTLRSSCYSCKRIMNENSDITIGDFWGIHKLQPDNNDQEGISVFLAHNEKALQYLDAIKENSSIEEIPLSAIDYIYREANDRAEIYHERNEVMKRVVKNGYMAVVKKRLGLKIRGRKIKDGIHKTLRPILRWIRKR